MTPTPETLEQLKMIAGYAEKKLPPINDQAWAIMAQQTMCYAWLEAAVLAIMAAATVVVARGTVKAAREEAESPAVIVGVIFLLIFLLLSALVSEDMFSRFSAPELHIVKQIMGALK